MPKVPKSKTKDESDEEVDLGSEIESEPEELDLEAELQDVNTEDQDHSEPEINAEDIEDSDSEQENDFDVISQSNATTKTIDYFEPKNIKERPAFAIIKIVKPDERKSTNVMQQIEYARVIGLRAVKLEKGEKPTVKVNPGMTLYDIAKQELFEKKISFVIRRYVNTSLAEDWTTSEMDINATRFCTTD